MDAANEERVREKAARSVLRFSTQCLGHKQRFGAPPNSEALSYNRQLEYRGDNP